MEIPAAMLLDWAKRIDGQGLMLNTQEVKKVCQELRTYATSRPSEQKALQQFFYNRPE